MQTIALPTTTTDRLLAVADIVEFSPERWDQATWFRDVEENYDFPSRVVGRGFAPCGTAGCVAGWAVALSPELPRVLVRSWDEAGEVALGLHPSVAVAIFDGSLHQRMNHVELADVLRRLAKLDEGYRNAGGARGVLTAAQLAMLNLEPDDAE